MIFNPPIEAPIETLSPEEFKEYLKKPSLYKEMVVCKYCQKGFSKTGGYYFFWECPKCKTLYKGAKFGKGYRRKKEEKIKTIREKVFPLTLKGSTKKMVDFSTKEICYYWTAFIWFPLNKFRNVPKNYFKKLCN